MPPPHPTASPTLEAPAFRRRFRLHLLPAGFVRLRPSACSPPSSPGQAGAVPPGARGPQPPPMADPSPLAGPPARRHCPVRTGACPRVARDPWCAGTPYCPCATGPAGFAREGCSMRPCFPPAPSSSAWRRSWRRRPVCRRPAIRAALRGTPLAGRMSRIPFGLNLPARPFSPHSRSTGPSRSASPAHPSHPPSPRPRIPSPALFPGFVPRLLSQVLAAGTFPLHAPIVASLRKESYLLGLRAVDVCFQLGNTGHRFVTVKNSMAIRAKDSQFCQCGDPLPVKGG